MPGALSLFLCLLCAIGIAGYFFRPEPQPAVRKEEPRLVGTRDVVIAVGEALPDLKEGLGVNDAVERVEIDTGAVDTGTAGEYPIIYRYTDVQGETHEIETTCTVTAEDSPGTTRSPEEKTGEDTSKKRGPAGQQEKEGQTQRQEQKSGQTEQEALHTTPPQTDDKTAFLGYAALFLASLFLSLLLFLWRCVFG